MHAQSHRLVQVTTNFLIICNSKWHERFLERPEIPQLQRYLVISAVKVKVRFFSRLKNMDLNRWPKLLLNALFIVSNQSGCDLSWKWLNSIGNILSKNNLSSMFNANSEINEHGLILLITLMINLLVITGTIVHVKNLLWICTLSLEIILFRVLSFG